MSAGIVQAPTAAVLRMQTQQTTLPASAASSWRPPFLVKASVACHLGAGLVVAQSPALWPWVVGGVGLNHALLAATSLWPRSTWLGDNLVRLPAASAARREVSITIDDGPDPAVTPQVLDLLDEHQARATFFCIADNARRHPELCRDIVRRGHSVQNHTQRHAHTFAFLGMRGFTREIGRAQDTLADITGQLPRFFRAPAGLRNPLLAPVLQRLDLQLVSWTRRGFDTVQREPARVLVRLSQGMAAGDILLLHDGNAARASTGEPVLLQVLPELLKRFEQQGLRAVTLPDAVQAVNAVPAAHAENAA
jgi:peptidoglycan-N-acetylglucosamine deacetylase